MKPFLKWAGNKIHIIERVREKIGSGQRLVEPFLGSGAVFLNSDFESYLLSDTNPDLINLYLTLQKQGKEFVDYCESLFCPEYNQEDKFYELREMFNNQPDPVLKSAILVYLNRHCYNGLIRYNLKGGFNTPFGRYQNPYFPRTEMLYFFEKSQRAQFFCQDFETSMLNAKRGDVIYCDPPYSPISKTANFTSYSAKPFGPLEQMRLVKVAWLAAKHGSRVVISNHSTEFTEDAYQGMSVNQFEVQRTISCKAKGRNKVLELIAVMEPSAQV